MRPGSVELQLETCHHKDNSRDSTVNAGDNPDQPPAPPMLHSLRPHKLCQFSGEEGDAEDFIREANLFLELQPMADPAAAGWLLGSLEGRAKQEELSMGAGDINSPGKIFVILEQHWGEHRDSSTLAGAFFTHQQGLTESVGEYTSNFRLLWAKTNAVQAGTLSEVMLQDTFMGGLHPVSRKRDIKHYIQENADAAFAGITREALRWMREDSCPDINAACSLPLQSMTTWCCKQDFVCAENCLLLCNKSRLPSPPAVVSNLDCSLSLQSITHVLDRMRKHVCMS